LPLYAGKWKIGVQWQQKCFAELSALISLFKQKEGMGSVYQSNLKYPVCRISMLICLVTKKTICWLVCHGWDRSVDLCCSMVCMFNVVHCIIVPINKHIKHTMQYSHRVLVFCLDWSDNNQCNRGSSLRHSQRPKRQIRAAAMH
jgi:hypothetical protein